jgi:hypothetical protein
MARTAVSKRIGDTTYHVTPLTTSESLGAAVRVANTLGPAVKLLSTGGVVAFGQVLSDLKQEDIEFFTSMFRPVSVVEVKGKRLALDAVYEDFFAANLGALFDWLAFCIEVNFKSFFPKIAALVSKQSSGDAESPAEKTDASP